MINSIEIKNVEKKFGDKKVLNNISLTMKKGELLGLLGPSGAGKTTLIKIVTGQLSYEGDSKVFGVESSMIGSKIYKQVGMVLDNCGIYERLSVYDNMKVFADIYRICKARIDDVLVKVGLIEAKKTIAGKLSKGMRQRLLLARAILHEPSILFLDEPTSGLDPVTTKQIHALLMELKNKGTTIFLTTHNMEEAYQICDHIALLNEGRIVEYGIPEELCRKYNKENCITIITKNGESVIIANKPSSARIITDYMEKDDIEAIHSSEPNLESVFITLTGRGLAEA